MIPRLGAKRILKIATMEAITTIAGPVGILEIVELAMVPSAEESAPIKADKITIGSNRLVHCLAAMDGAINIALIKIIPTACIESRTVVIVKNDNKIFNFPPGKPNERA